MLQDVRPGLPIVTTASANTGVDREPCRELGHDDGDAPQRPVRSGTTPGFILALVLHAAIVVPMLLAGTEPMGGGGADLDAISVEVTLVAATARESRATTEATAAASAASIDPTEGAELAAPAAVAAISTAAAVTKPEPVTPDQAEPPKAAARPTPDEQLPPADAAAPQLEPPRETEPAKTSAEPARLPPEAEPVAATATAAVAAPASVAQQSGGAAARASSPAETSHAAAAATPGAIKAFARSVAEALGRSRPKGLILQAKGTVRVAFAVATSGELDFVRVSNSSGRADLDDAAIGAVKRARFPMPPPGLDLVHRTYDVPYHFR